MMAPVRVTPPVLGPGSHPEMRCEWCGTLHREAWYATMRNGAGRRFSIRVCKECKDVLDAAEAIR